MLLFSINRSRGYENPSLDIIVTERCSTGGCPLEEACEHCYLIQSAISVAISYIISVYCEDYAGYFTVILSFLAFRFCSAYFIYLVSCILVDPDDQEKTTFTTSWVMFMYAKMPFGIMNAGENFQRAMDIESTKEKGKFIVIYLEDITLFFDFDEQHLEHLKKVFQKYIKFYISLNPKKSNFRMQEGKALGHIISKEGIKIDPNRVKGILNIITPWSKKEVQSFLGKVNFLRRFILNLAKIINHITSMIRKGNEIKWTPKSRNSFEDIKVVPNKSPVLTNPNFTRDFILLSFSSEHTIVGVLLQKDEHNFKNPIVYFNRTFRDSPLRYGIMEKQVYALVKAHKEFKTYILHSHIIAYVPSNSIKDILTQPDLEGRRGK
jgi:hypothetical protein